MTDHEDGPVQAERGSWLCWRCRDDVQTALIGIGRSWPALQDLLYPSKTGGQVGGKSVDPAVPVELATVDITVKVEAAVSALASHFLEDRPDLRIASGKDSGAVAGEIGRWHLSWLTTHPQPRFTADSLVEVWEAWRSIPRAAGRLDSVPPVDRWIEHARARRG
ncbi:hypothetical protein SPF06_07105 [Sinomonas sp. JGH33]|uniref:Uncharacterized protein n=1 Tax=Sinomonas terricola TaxID=3110330 RepID=A0ABU5T4A0_9MICC|nr:hypothetical protein [Sinomonas sp. JGH33]MEA5454485.1 hypothetical protein [Sinomonas sp. JGH33]